jgi:hypothetical protein
VSDSDCGLYSSWNLHLEEACEAAISGPRQGCCPDSIIPYAAAANRSWIGELAQFCASRPPGGCPAGNGPPVWPACSDGHCVVSHDQR